MCGGQLVVCNCARGFGVAANGDPTESAYEKFDAAVAALGGRLPWSGILYEAEEKIAIEQGWWVLWKPHANGFHGTWEQCATGTPEARADSARVIQSYRWDPKLGRRVKP